MSTAKDYRAMDKEARTKELESLLREQFNLRMQKATAQLVNSAALAKVRPIDFFVALNHYV